MNTYMVNIQLPLTFTEQFLSLIPQQKAKIDQLMNEGKIIQYSLSADRSLLWVIIMGDSEKNINDILSSFPLINFMKPKIHELLFHHSNSIALPKLIMN
jgi:muconolactone delta-isomerase